MSAVRDKWLGPMELTEKGAVSSPKNRCADGKEGYAGLHCEGPWIPNNKNIFNKIIIHLPFETESWYFLKEEKLVLLPY